MSPADDEVWKPVPSMPGLWASSHGRVRLDPYSRVMPRGGIRVYTSEPTFGVIRQSSKGARHVYFGYRYQGIGNVKIHIAVCEAFHGPKPHPKAIVRHVNENGLENHPGNLEWATQRRNMNDPALKRYHSERAGRHLTAMPKAKKREGVYDSVLDIALMRQAIYEARAA